MPEPIDEAAERPPKYIDIRERWGIRTAVNLEYVNWLESRAFIRQTDALQQKTAKENTKELLDDAIKMLEERNKELEEVKRKLIAEERASHFFQHDNAELGAKVKQYAEALRIVGYSNHAQHTMVQSDKDRLDTAISAAQSEGSHQ